MDDVLDVFNVAKREQPSLDDLESMMMNASLGGGDAVEEDVRREGGEVEGGVSEGEGAEEVKEDEPLFNPLQAGEEEEQVDIREEPGYRKDIYAADFVDFDNDFCKTPRFIRPRTEIVEERSRPGTSVSWVSSAVSAKEEEEGGAGEVPFDTWVDEPRLLNAFEKIREKFVMEADSHGDSCEKLEKLKKDLIFENEVNVVQREQLKKEDKHTSVVMGKLKDIKRDYKEMVDSANAEINRLYKDIDDTREEIKRVQGEKMQQMFRVQRTVQEITVNEAEIKRFKELKELTVKENDKTQKESDILQIGLKTVKEIGKSGQEEFEKTSWQLENGQKLVDSLILRTGKAEDDAKMWQQRYKMASKDLSHVQKLMMSMTGSHTETQAILYRDRALHYLKSVGGGAGIKQTVVSSGIEGGSTSSLLSDALKAPELRKEVGRTGRASKIRGVGRNGKMYTLEGGGEGGGMGKKKGRDARTPDVRVTKKKLKNYMEKSGVGRSDGGGKRGVKKRDGGQESFAKTMLGEMEGVKGQEDFQALLRAELENEAREYGGGGGFDAPMSRMSRISEVSKMSGMTAKSTLSEGSMLRWKTGVARKRKEKAQRVRDDWVGVGEGLGGGEEMFAGVNRVGVENLDLPF